MLLILNYLTQVAQAYQNTRRGSREFNLRLIEVLVVICHDIAVSLYTRYKGGLRKPDPEAIHRQLLAPELPAGITLAPVKPKPVELFHPSYQNWEKYPNGLCDMVGYWTEYRLFGGVVLFDRGESGSACNDAFIHPIRRYQIFELSDAQVQHYVDSLLLSGVELDSGNIRFHAEEYARRIDPYDAMDLHIYRDKYERKIPEIRLVRCVGRAEDMPVYEQSLKDFATRCAQEYWTGVCLFSRLDRARRLEQTHLSEVRAVSAQYCSSTLFFLQEPFRPSWNMENTVSAYMSQDTL